MPKPVIKPFDVCLVADVAALLAERNRTLAAYVSWKYGSQETTRSLGAIAYMGEQPVGFFGLIPRQLQQADGTELSIGWFADWYVTPAQRGSGLGRLLLEAITTENLLTLGHPGTTAAQRLCAQLGYQALPFQARHRLVLKPWLYEKLRTRFAVKAIAQLFKHQAQAHWQGLTAAQGKVVEDSVYLAAPAAYGRWIFQQPVRPPIRRAYETWEENGLQVAFCEDQLPSGETRRRILFHQGAASLDLAAWRVFVTSARQANCAYLELFTTSRALSALWQAMGALSYPDAPVMFKGPLPPNLLLHGWDRENWTFLADQIPTTTAPDFPKLPALREVL
jgi:GNAT superfamily N-acetyltransferase